MNPGILSCGAVSPGGIGVDALKRAWSASEVMNGAGNGKHPAGLVDRNLPELRRWDKAPRLRRASPISCYMIEAVQQALEAAPGIDLSRTGVVVAFFLGCIAYSVRFYRQFSNEGRRFASPLLFPETVFNSPVSHVVSTLGIGGPVYTQVGDKSCWATAMRTAECWLRCGTAENVLVLGAEEFDPHELDAFKAAGWLRKGGFIPSEGAGAVLLTSQPCDVQLTGLSDGHLYWNKKQARQAARNCLKEFPENTPVQETASGWMQPLATDVCAGRLSEPERSLSFEAFTAAAAWDTILAAQHLRQTGGEMVVPYWGLSQQFAAARFSVI